MRAGAQVVVAGTALFPRRIVRCVECCCSLADAVERIVSLPAVGVWRAALAQDWRKHVSAGEQAVVILLGADKRQAAILRKYCRGLLEAPRLRAEVVRDTDEVIEFATAARWKLPPMMRGWCAAEAPSRCWDRSVVTGRPMS